MRSPALDGLRGLAVVAVVVFHHSQGWLPGGFLGVDVFFVLSGFLITTILLSSSDGSVTRRLAQFWGRRARRLLPAMVLALVLVAAWAAWVASPDLARRVRGDGLAALAQVANWRFLFDEQSYFSEFVPSPVRHFWSLSVEMQWYVLWPPVVFAIVALAGRRRAPIVVAAAASGLALASTVLMAVLYDATGNTSRVYYGTDTHATPLLIGAALAGVVIALDRRTTSHGPVLPPAAGLVAVAGFAGLVSAMAMASGTAGWVYRGGFLAVSLLTAAIIAASRATSPTLTSNPVAWVLAQAPLRWLGMISYGVYLFHWPLFFLVTSERTGLDGAALFAARAAATLVVATMSYLIVERPVLTGRLVSPERAPVAFSGAVGLAVTALVVATIGIPRGWADGVEVDALDRPPPVAAPATTVAGSDEDLEVSDAGDLEHRDARVLVVGDSVAYSLALGFGERGMAEPGLAVWNQGILYCELLSAPRREGGVEQEADGRCAGWPVLWGRFIEEFSPDLAVVVIGPWEVFDRKVDGSWVSFGDPAHDALVVAHLEQAVEVLSSDGAQVAFLTVPPLDRTDGVSASEWTLRERWRVDHLNSLIAQVAERRADQVEVIDLGGLVCPGGDCALLAGGTVLRGDGIHYTSDGAALLARALRPILLDAAAPVLERRGATVPEEAEVASPTPEPPGEHIDEP